MGFCCLYTAHQTTEAVGAPPAEVMSWRSGILDGSTPKDGSPRLLDNASTEAQYKRSREALWTGFADDHHAHNS